MIIGNISTHFQWFPELHYTKETEKKSYLRNQFCSCGTLKE